MTFYEYITEDKLLYNAYLYLLNNNKGVNNYYHNNTHIIDVAKTCYDLAVESNIASNYIRVLVMAALFHDFNHCGNKSVTDDVNIKEAIKELRIFLNIEKNIFQYDYAPYVEFLIESTEFPHKNTSDLNIDSFFVPLISIIRDADMSQILKNNWVEMCIYNLSKEWEQPLKEYLTNEISFINNLHFNSVILQADFDNKKPMLIKICQNILKYV